MKKINLGRVKGDTGESAYELAKRLHKPNTDSEEEWIESLKGEKGQDGIQGPAGEVGKAGETGPEGKPGKSAFDIAQEYEDYEDEEAWLESLKGKKGQDGAKGDRGEDGTPGDKGDTGESAYELARRLGKPNTETESGWIDSLKGQKGEAGADGQQGSPGERGLTGEDGFSPVVSISNSGNTHTITIRDKEDTKTVTITDGRDGRDGEQGQRGADGDKGDTGESAYELAKRLHKPHTGSEEEWITSLKGETGEQGQRGNDGARGQDGANGEKGDNGESAYELARRLGKPNTDSEDEWIESLKGEKGQDGAKGDRGETGMADLAGSHTWTGTNKYTNSIIIEKNDEVQRMQPATANNSCYYTFYKNKSNRSGYLGYPSMHNSDFVIVNEADRANINFRATNGQVQVNGKEIAVKENTIAWVHGKDHRMDSADNFKTTGYTKTNNHTRAESLPDVNNKWGVLQYLAESESAGTGIQYFYPVDGNARDRIFVRSCLQNSWSNWRELAENKAKKINIEDTAQLYNASNVEEALAEAKREIDSIKAEFTSSKATLKSNIDSIKEVL